MTKWIKVTTRLPADFRMVETKRDTGQSMPTIHLMFRSENKWTTANDWPAAVPTHWRPVATGRKL